MGRRPTYQYADAGFLDFLNHLIDWVRDLPVSVLVLARPELGQARPGFGAGPQPGHAALDPVGGASMDQLDDKGALFGGGPVTWSTLGPSDYDAE